MKAIPENYLAPKVLAVDLDGTLLRSDMLHESFWSALGRNWRDTAMAAVDLLKGRAAMKRRLAAAADIDVTTLPYDARVIDYVCRWRQGGGTTALVTASDQILAERIAENLGIFEEVHGSDGVRNLKGAKKAEFLIERFGRGGFAYMGDSAADLPVWDAAGLAVTVDAAKALRENVERRVAHTEHLTPKQDSSGIMGYVRAIRPHQWMKNTLVFVPILAAHKLDGQSVAAALLAFVCFSLVASGVYVLNDLLDLRADRAHPRKRARPFASGQVPIAHGSALAAGLLGSGAALSLVSGAEFFLIMLAYFLMTSAYSISLKRQVVLDIFVLAGLYTLRIAAGGVAAGVTISVWLLAFSGFIFLALAAIKRQAELIDSNKRGQLTATGRGYHVDDIPMIAMVAIAAGNISVLVLALYINSPGVTELYSWPEALWAGCAVLLYWINRTSLLTHRGKMADDPVVYAIKDRTSQICLIIIAASIIMGAGA